MHECFYLLNIRSFCDNLCSAFIFDSVQNLKVLSLDSFQIVQRKDFLFNSALWVEGNLKKDLKKDLKNMCIVVKTFL